MPACDQFNNPTKLTWLSNVRGSLVTTIFVSTSLLHSGLDFLAILLNGLKESGLMADCSVQEKSKM